MTTDKSPDFAAALRSLASKAEGSKRVCLLCHQNADPDAVCSAYVLQALLRDLAPGLEVEICCPEGVGASTKQLIENLGIPVPVKALSWEPDMVILVDTNTLDQLGKTGEALKESDGKLVVVDHHHPHPDMEKLADQMIVDEEAAAAAEVVYRLVKAGKHELDTAEATALLAATYVETKHFLLARKSTFEMAAGLVESGANPRRLSEMFTTPMNMSERIARLKSAGRSDVIVVGDWIIASSQLGSYQSSAARGLLSLGAHVAFVAGEAKGRVRVNMRATEWFWEKTRIHLGRDVAIPLGRELDGTGGGHPSAAGLSANGDVEDCLKACVDRVRKLLEP